MLLQDNKDTQLDELVRLYSLIEPFMGLDLKGLPRTIATLRHGESEGNSNAKEYLKGDYKVRLTQFGAEQIVGSALSFRGLLEGPLKGRDVYIYFSPFVRAVQSKDIALSLLPHDRILSVEESPWLREQNMGISRIYLDPITRELLPETLDSSLKHPDPMFREHLEEFFYYRHLCDTGNAFHAVPPLGESSIEPVRRTIQFFNEIRGRVPEDAVVLIVAHKDTNRSIEMNLTKQTPEWYPTGKSNNGDIVCIERDGSKYVSSVVHTGKPRLPSLSRDYKAEAFTGLLQNGSERLLGRSRSQNGLAQL